MSLSLFSTIFLNGSCPAAIDARRLALELSSANWFKWVTWYGYAVAVGCAMEVWEVLVTIKGWCLLKFRKKEVEEDRKSWAIPFAAVGLIVIVAGIVLETYCEGKAADAETELRNHFSDQLSTAEEAAAKATEDAGNADKETAQLQKDTQGLKTEAANAERDMAAAQLELARLTGPPYRVKIIDGVATPDLSKSLTQLIVLKTNGVRIRAPKLPPLQEGGVIKWTLLLDEDEVGFHPYTLELKGDTNSMPGLVPNSRTPMEFETDSTGRTSWRSIPAVNIPTATKK